MTRDRSIQELSDDKLVALASRRSDVEITRDKVAALEISIREARNAHDRRFGVGQVFGSEVQASLQQISGLEEQLMWAKKQLDVRQFHADAKRAHEAREAHSALPKNRIFEVRDDAGRVLRHHAASADHLRQELTPGYAIVSEVFGFHADGTGGVAVSTDPDVPTLLDGILQAHGSC